MIAMADPLRDELNRMLDAYDARRKAADARERKVKDDDLRFLADFADLRRAVVRPVFEEAGAVLAARGHGFEIEEQEFAADAAGQPSEAGITIRIAPLGAEPLRAEDHSRSLSITTRHYNKNVWINAGESQDAGGVAGAKGAYPLGKIDRQLIEDALLKFVARVIEA
jgi:hypothetical protein